MIQGIGTDIVEVHRIENAIENLGDRFKNKMFTQSEIDYCEQFKLKKYTHYAARFAAKEAFSKAIGTGFARGFKFKEVSVNNLKSGEPQIALDGEMREKYSSYNIKLSLSHSRTNAIAYLIMEEK
jgi:holo-[acyl-carrier protein] synthase